MLFEFCKERFKVELNRFDRIEYKNGELMFYGKSSKDRVKFKRKDIVELFELMESNRLTKTGIEIFYFEEARWDDDDYLYFVSTTLKDHFEIYSD